MTIDNTVFRYTNCDVPITSSSNIYSPRGFKIDPIGYSLGTIVDQVGIQIDNIDSMLSASFTGSTPQGSEAVLSLVILDDNLDLVGGTHVTLFEGEIDSFTLKEDTVKMTVTSKLAQWSQKTLSKHSASCRWKVFNSSTLGTVGTECASTAGEAWCDRTYDRCAALSNTTNFGGFRWLPSIVDKDIWWGRIKGE
jgi:hypothetical protein